MTEPREPLSDVPQQEAFHTCNGVVLNNLSELANYLTGCSDYDFRYHVNGDHHKNDFAIWVREAVKDEPLARELDGEMRREWYLKKIRTRLTELIGGMPRR